MLGVAASSLVFTVDFPIYIHNKKWKKDHGKHISNNDIRNDQRVHQNMLSNFLYKNVMHTVKKIVELSK